MPVKAAEDKIISGEEMLRKYHATKDKALRNEIVLFYQSLIKYAVFSTRNMYQKYADAEDITNEAYLALISAVETFDPDKNVKFESYASMKMRGAIIDYIRRQDIIPRSVRAFAKELENVYSKLYAKLSREPSTDEIAEEMGVPKEKLLKNMADAAAASSLSFEELLYEDGSEIFVSDEGGGIWNVEKNLYLKERAKMLAKAIEELKEQQRLVITLYYYEKLKFSDIAKVLDVSESRVCQIHSKAMLKLKYNMEQYIKG